MVDLTEDELIKKTLTSAKTIAMVGVSSIKEEVSTNIKRRPSIIVMKYLQEFGYRVIPVNPFSTGKKIYGETIISKLDDEVLKLAKKIASKSNLTIKIGKKAFYKQLEMPLNKAYKYASKVMTKNMMALDAREGISAFLEKRNPNWQNK